MDFKGSYRLCMDELVDRVRIPIQFESLYQTTNIFIKKAPSLEHLSNFRLWDILPPSLKNTLESSKVDNLTWLKNGTTHSAYDPGDVVFPHPTLQGFHVFLANLQFLFTRLTHANWMQNEIDEGCFKGKYATVTHGGVLKLQNVFLLDTLGIQPSVLRERLEAGLARGIQLELLAIVMRSIVGGIRLAVLEAFEGDGEVSSMYQRILNVSSAVTEICAENIPLVLFLVDLRSESIEARIWRYVGEE
ncbi:hypothetical protein BJ508DRAFT_418870 [Ascobolus immersus RN42]|uniref:Uncharacterized protein n=1 Tax=Ascobolus immersus RN42 TaxID=1160509 RepID=A0A3N4HIW6_ASCIM|nr:hypothetical protein BJ508DRAFT_418870 [Ascobolus immersus RN42]